MAKLPHNMTEPISWRRSLQRLPDSSDTSIKMQPPTIRQKARNHHTVNSDRMIFMPGQFKPQNSDNEASSKIGVIEDGDNKI